MTPAEQIIAVRENPGIWLEAFGKILTKERRLEAPRLNVLQRRMVEAYLWCRLVGIPCRIIVLKPRQKGSSTGSTGIAYTHLRNFNAAGVFIGDEYVTTDRLVEMFNRYAEEDSFPSWGSSYDKTKRVFSNGSKLEKETAGDRNAGRGGTFQLIVASEVAHWPNDGVKSAQAILLSLLQVQPDTANTVTIIESTPNGPAGEYYQRWQGARYIEEHQAGNTGSGYIRIFAAWYEFDDSSRAVTERERQEIEKTLTEREKVLIVKHGVTTEQLAWRRSVIGNKVKDEQEFDQEYPTDPESCFIASGSPRFSVEGMYRQERYAQNNPPKLGVIELQERSEVPLFVPTDNEEATFQLWEEPRHGCLYLMAWDSMTGASQTAGARDPDSNAVQVWRKGYIGPDHQEFPTRMVASIDPKVSQADPDIMLDHVVLLSRFFGWCMCAPEINNSTGLVEMLRMAGVPLYRRRRWDKVKNDWDTKYGWQTTDASRRDMIDNLAKWVRQEENGVPLMECASPRWLSQMKNFVVKPNGRAEAKEGCHDDEVMCSAIALKCLDAGTTYLDPHRAAQAQTVRELFGRMGGGGSDRRAERC